jgi:hypothetical protein
MERERITQVRTASMLDRESVPHSDATAFGLRAWNSLMLCGRLKSCHDKRQERFLASRGMRAILEDGYVLGMIVSLREIMKSCIVPMTADRTAARRRQHSKFRRQAGEIVGNGELLDMASFTRYVRVHQTAFV